MIQKPDIDKKIAEQKENLLAHLTVDTKLPVADIVKYSFDNNTFHGQFSITIDGNKKQILSFKYENQIFSWDITTIKTDLEAKWGQVFSDNQIIIKEKIKTDLQIDTDNADRISCGQKNIIYVYEKNSPTPIAVIAEYNNNQWTVSKR